MASRRVLLALLVLALVLTSAAAKKRGKKGKGDKPKKGKVQLATECDDGMGGDTGAGLALASKGDAKWVAPYVEQSKGRAAAHGMLLIPGLGRCRNRRNRRCPVLQLPATRTFWTRLCPGPPASARSAAASWRASSTRSCASPRTASPATSASKSRSRRAAAT